MWGDMNHSKRSKGGNGSRRVQHGAGKRYRYRGKFPTGQYRRGWDNHSIPHLQRSPAVSPLISSRTRRMSVTTDCLKCLPARFATATKTHPVYNQVTRHPADHAENQLHSASLVASFEHSPLGYVSAS
ncbi:hypothetical protein ACOMHN_031769 [Nucella lapillus]